MHFTQKEKLSLGCHINCQRGPCGSYATGFPWLEPRNTVCREGGREINKHSVQSTEIAARQIQLHGRHETRQSSDDPSGEPVCNDLQVSVKY